MPRTLMVILAIALLIFISGGCDREISGGPCEPIGGIKVSKGQTYTCVKNTVTGKGYWYKGTP